MNWDRRRHLLSLAALGACLPARAWSREVDAEARSFVLAARDAERRGGTRPKDKVYRVAVLRPAAERDGEALELHPDVEAVFVKRGFVPGKNLRLEVVSLPGVDRAATSAKVQQLVETRPDAIVAMAAWQAKAVQDATQTIPIVFNAGNPHLVVDSLRRPGRNATGVSRLGEEFNLKTLELVREILPRARRLAVIASYATLAGGPRLASFRKSALALGLEIVEGDVSAHGGDAGAAAASTLAARPEAMLVYEYIGPPQMQNRRVAELAAKHRIPLFGGRWGRTIAEVGPDVRDTQKRMAAILVRVLEGESPAEIPVDQAVRSIISVNPGYARELGIEIPASLLMRADRVESD